MSLMYIAFFECVAIVWIYGTKRMAANIKDMTGSYPNFIFRLLWQYISPLLILVSFLNQYKIIVEVAWLRPIFSGGFNGGLDQFLIKIIPLDKIIVKTLRTVGPLGLPCSTLNSHAKIDIFHILGIVVF